MPMSTGTKRVAFTAMLCALSVIVLYLSSILPTLRLALIAIAGILPAAAVIRFGLPSGFILYAAVSILAAILLPSKGSAILYIFIFGHYPMIKNLIERLRRLWLEWVLKLALFNILLTALILLFSAAVLDLFALKYPLPIIFGAGSIAFAAYDIGFTGLIAASMKWFKRLK
jgi:hypothetical protein